MQSSVRKQAIYKKVLHNCKHEYFLTVVDFCHFVAYLASSESPERDDAQIQCRIFTKIPPMCLEIVSKSFLLLWLMSSLHENKQKFCSTMLNCQFTPKTSGKCTNWPSQCGAFLKLGQTNSCTIDHEELTATDWNFKWVFCAHSLNIKANKAPPYAYTLQHLQCIEGLYIRLFTLCLCPYMWCFCNVTNLKFWSSHKVNKTILYIDTIAYDFWCYWKGPA